jgi:hypothetical protein
VPTGWRAFSGCLPGRMNSVARAGRRRILPDISASIDGGFDKWGRLEAFPERFQCDPKTNLAIAVLGNAANAFVMRYPSGDPQFSHCGGWHSARGVPRRIWNRQRSNALSMSDAWRSKRRCDAGVGTHRSTASNIPAGDAR